VPAVVAVAWTSAAFAQAQTPVTGHYPPGQSGIRGASTPAAGLAITNFNRFFTNLELEDASGNPVQHLSELRYANITMITWTTGLEVLGLTYGALVGIPFATGTLPPTDPEEGASSLGLGDILVTPISLYGKTAAFDYQLQFTVWTPSGRFSPGSPRNRGTGFWALVYSLGGVYYPGGDRDAWSLSAVARFEQNFEQKDSGVTPGHDIVVDWGVGRVVHLGKLSIDAGVSGFATWQLTSQVGGTADTSRYRYFGAGPEASLPLVGQLVLRVRAQWEFGARNVVRGNNLWIIFNYRW
jgi:hypothetical protein